MRAIVIILVAVLVVVGGGAAFLATWNIPAPSAKVEKVIPNDRLGK
jgi:Flp pilus assembly protein CpaB